jgi:dedicated sortase system histidine kinase
LSFGFFSYASTPVKVTPFFRSIRARLLLIALLLLTIPLIGFRFIQEMDGYLREGQQQVLSSTARLLSATLSDRPQLFRADNTEGATEETDRRRLLALFSSADPEAAANLGGAYLPSEDIERILGVVATSASRIWVVDSHSRVRGLSGSLNAPASRTAPRADAGWAARFYASSIRPMLRAFTADNTIAPHEDPQIAQRAVMSQVDRALMGEANARWRAAGSASAVILSVAQPIWQGDNIVGAVVVEETTSGGQSLKTAALESLLATTLVVFAVGFVALLAFAWRLAFRVRRLQKEADGAIDAHGRIRGDIAGSRALDEIGALSRTLNATLQRLRQYNDYLEKMAARLSHELRTPVAVVRSSLDNLRQGAVPQQERVYIERAEEGVKRLSSLISRMSEATQLESMLRGAERETFDIVKVVAGCVEGYRLAFPNRQFQLRIDEQSPVRINGNAESIAQMLDKLVQNATDFAKVDSTIRLRLATNHGLLNLMVENEGPALPPATTSHLFVAMISSRAETDGRGGHLGLGLYIVRMIAEFHNGTVKAENLADDNGVCFTVTLPRV